MLIPLDSQRFWRAASWGRSGYTAETVSSGLLNNKKIYIYIYLNKWVIRKKIAHASKEQALTLY